MIMQAIESKYTNILISNTKMDTFLDASNVGHDNTFPISKSYVQLLDLFVPNRIQHFDVHQCESMVVIGTASFPL